MNSHAPIKTKRVRSGKVPKITSYLRRGMRDRNVAKRKATKSNDHQDWVYNRLRKKINGEVKSTNASKARMKNLPRHLMRLFSLMATHVNLAHD